MRGSGRSALYTADGTSSAWTITPTTTGHLCRAYGNLNTLLDYNNPPLTLGYYAYAGMFSGCTSLSEPPALPAKIIGNYAYSYMFNGCTKLKFAPNIAAVEVGNYSCRDMFHNCTSMITPAGRLNADVLSPYCYQYMFWNCTSLITAPVLPASQLAPYCYRNMFEDCSALINAPPDLSALSLVDRCYQYMFLRCDSLVTAPEIMATHYETYCCYAMFEDCSSLKNMKVHLTTWGSGNTDYWLNRTATNGIFTCPAELPDTRGIGRIPTTWTKVDL
jgi:hypothetical protein